MIYTIEVTEEDIKNGIVNCDSCPVALAMRRTIGIEFRVHGSYATIAGYKSYAFSLPEPVADFVHDFDNISRLWAVKPFSFNFELDDKEKEYFSRKL